MVNELSIFKTKKEEHGQNVIHMQVFFGPVIPPKDVLIENESEFPYVWYKAGTPTAITIYIDSTAILCDE